MAEFVEVMRWAYKICIEHKGNCCHKCPLLTSYGECRFKISSIITDPRKLEPLIMDWAAERPEPVYPSWEEAWNTLFHDAYDKRVPCLRYFLPHDRYVQLCEKSNGRCYECRHQPIPAEVAEKLGIRPKEGK